MISLKRNAEQDEDAYIWYADFYKVYENLINPAEKISIGWIPKINALYSLNIETNTYEKNEVKISKEEAIKIATDKDKKIETQKSIAEIQAEIRIRKMNANVYLREKYKDEYEKGTLNIEKIAENAYRLKEDAIFYKTEERVRKVWCVVIYYQSEGSRFNGTVTYYIDATTGEIIGGEMQDEFFSEKALKEDPNNVIEKRVP